MKPDSSSEDSNNNRSPLICSVCHECLDENTDKQPPHICRNCLALSRNNNNVEYSGRRSPLPSCRVCLGLLDTESTSYANNCLHAFCFDCLKKWLLVKRECPLCKSVIEFIIYNVKSDDDYDMYYLNSNLDENYDEARVIVNARASTSDRPQESLVPGESFATSSNQRPRRNIYITGEFSNRTANSRTMMRDAEYYRTHQYERDRLVAWLRRELQLLYSPSAETRIDNLLRFITHSLTQYNLRSINFYNQLEPALGPHTDHFLHELINYSYCDYTLADYDNNVTYSRNQNYVYYNPLPINPNLLAIPEPTSSENHQVPRANPESTPTRFKKHLCTLLSRLEKAVGALVHKKTLTTRPSYQQTIRPHYDSDDTSSGDSSDENDR